MKNTKKVQIAIALVAVGALLAIPLGKLMIDLKAVQSKSRQFNRLGIFTEDDSKFMAEMRLKYKNKQPLHDDDLDKMITILHKGPVRKTPDYTTEIIHFGIFEGLWTSIPLSDMQKNKIATETVQMFNKTDEKGSNVKFLCFIMMKHLHNDALVTEATGLVGHNNPDLKLGATAYLKSLGYLRQESSATSGQSVN